MECMGLSAECFVLLDWASQRDVFESFESLGESSG